MRPLFSDAPVIPAAAVMPAQPVGSQLAAALSGGRPPLNLPAANVGGNIPLGSMMQAANAARTPDPATLNATPQQGNMIQPTTAPWTASTQAPPTDPNWLQQLMPQMPGSIAGGNPNAAPQVPGMAPGMPPQMAGALPQ